MCPPLCTDADDLLRCSATVGNLGERGEPDILTEVRHWDLLRALRTGRSTQDLHFKHESELHEWFQSIFMIYKSDVFHFKYCITFEQSGRTFQWPQTFSSIDLSHRLEASISLLISLPPHTLQQSTHTAQLVSGSATMLSGPKACIITDHWCASNSQNSLIGKVQGARLEAATTSTLYHSIITAIH